MREKENPHEYELKLILAICKPERNSKGDYFVISNKCRPSFCVNGECFPSEVDTNGKVSEAGNFLKIRVSVLSEGLMSAVVGDSFELRNGRLVIGTGCIQEIKNIAESKGPS